MRCGIANEVNTNPLNIRISKTIFLRFPFVIFLVALYSAMIFSNIRINAKSYFFEFIIMRLKTKNTAKILIR